MVYSKNVHKIRALEICFGIYLRPMANDFIPVFEG